MKNSLDVPLSQYRNVPRSHRSSINQTFSSGSVPLKTRGGIELCFIVAVRACRRTLDLQASSIDFERQYDRDRADRRTEQKGREGFRTLNIGDVAPRVGTKGR